MKTFSLEFYAPYGMYNLKGKAETMQEAARIIKQHLINEDLDYLANNEYKDVSFDKAQIPFNQIR